MAKRNGNIPSIRAGVVAPQGFSSLKATITLISNQEEVICTDPVYHARAGASPQVSFGTSCIVAQPRSDLRFGKICYIQLLASRRPVVVVPQKDGSIRIGGAYVDSIAWELGLTPLPRSDAPQGRNEAWKKALDDGSPIRPELLPETTKNKPSLGWDGTVVAAEA